MNYTKINNLLGWICALIATVAYIMTAERSTSWWDCGEFIASAFKLQIVHQPGAPLFLMIQNIFSNLAGGDVTRIAFWMNVGSAVCSGLTILFLFWTITALARKIIVKGADESFTATDLIKIFGSGAVGALAYAFTDTFWFSAVESEVYAMSSLCTAVVFWGILKWENHADEPGADRWLIFIAYVMGLSIGVHLLNLLVIPAIALVIYFKRTKTVTSSGATKAFFIGVELLAGRQDDGVQPALGVGQLHPVAGDEGPRDRLPARGLGRVVGRLGGLLLRVHGRPAYGDARSARRALGSVGARA